MTHALMHVAAFARSLIDRLRIAVDSISSKLGPAADRNRLSSQAHLAASQKSLNSAADELRRAVSANTSRRCLAPWFMRTFLDLSIDLAHTTRQRKRLVVMWVAGGCPQCVETQRVHFANAAIVEYVQKHFDVIQLDVAGGFSVIDFDGRSLSAQTLADKYRIDATPTFQFFSEAHTPCNVSEVARMSGYVEPTHFLAMFQFVYSRAYERISFHRFAKNEVRQLATDRLLKRPLSSLAAAAIGGARFSGTMILPATHSADDPPGSCEFATFPWLIGSATFGQAAIAEAKLDRGSPLRPWEREVALLPRSCLLQHEWHSTSLASECFATYASSTLHRSHRSVIGSTYETSSS